MTRPPLTVRACHVMPVSARSHPPHHQPPLTFIRAATDAENRHGAAPASDGTAAEGLCYDPTGLRASYRQNAGSSATSRIVPATHITPPDTTEVRTPAREATAPASKLPSVGPDV